MIEAGDLCRPPCYYPDLAGGRPISPFPLSPSPLANIMTCQERYWVETGFRSGTLLTLTATSTLAAGLMGSYRS